MPLVCVVIIKNLPVNFFFQVKLENHILHIHDDKDSTDSVVVKIKLSNCVVKDWSDEQRPYVMEIRRTLGRPHYLQAQNESGARPKTRECIFNIITWIFFLFNDRSFYHYWNSCLSLSAFKLYLFSLFCDFVFTMHPYIKMITVHN